MRSYSRTTLLLVLIFAWLYFLPAVTNAQTPWPPSYQCVKAPGPTPTGPVYSGPQRCNASFNPDVCQSAPLTQTGTQAMTCDNNATNPSQCVRSVGTEQSCFFDTPDDCSIRNSTYALTDQGCSWSKAANQPSCLSGNQAASSDSQCCSGQRYNGRCKYTFCAKDTSSPRDPNMYVLGCCNEYNQSGAACVQSCPAPRRPSGLRPDGFFPSDSPLCPNRRFPIRWDRPPSGKETILRVNAPGDITDDESPSGFTPVCNAPSGKDNQGDECTGRIPNGTTSWDYRFGGAGRYHVWIHHVNACNQVSSATDSFIQVTAPPQAPNKIYLDGTLVSGGYQTSPGAHWVGWNIPSNADANVSYKLFMCENGRMLDLSENPPELTSRTCDPQNNASYGKTFSWTTLQGMSNNRFYNYPNFSNGNSYGITIQAAACSYNSDFSVNVGINVCQAPTAPTITGVFEDSGKTDSYIQTRDAYVFWTPPTNWGAGCGGGTRSYTLTIKNKATGAVVGTYPNISSTSTFRQIGKILSANIEYTAELTANVGTATSITGTRDFTKYPVIGSISGTIFESGIAACTSPIDKTNLNLLDLVSNNNTNITTMQCALEDDPGDPTKYASYRCDIKLNNESADPVTNRNYGYTFSPVFGTGGLYDDVFCNPASSSNACISTPSCKTPQIALNLDKNSAATSTDITRHIFFNRATQSYFKVKNASVSTRTALSVIFPSVTPKPFEDAPPQGEGDVTQPAGKGLLNIGNTTALFPGVGVFTSPSTPSLANVADVSPKGWKNFGYTRSTTTFDQVRANIQSGKDVPLIPNLGSITGDGLYSIKPSSQLTLDDSFFDDKKVVLFIDGSAIISADFKPINGYVTIIARSLTIDDGPTELRGIFAADNISFNNSTSPLKIVGNIASLNGSISSLSKRARTIDPERPSTFMVFSPSYFYQLLSLLSNSGYDWKQIQ